MDKEAGGCKNRVVRIGMGDDLMLELDLMTR